MSGVALRRKVVLVSLCVAIGLFFTGTAVALLGDLNIDGVVDPDDMEIIAAAYGSNNRVSGPSPHWDWRADLDHDDAVNLEDLALAARNYGDDFNVHWRRRISNGREGDPERDDPDAQRMVIDSQGRRHIIWCDTTTSFQGGYLYYTQLDAAGNPLVEDRFVGYIASSPSMDLAPGPQNQVHIAWRGNLGSYNQDIVYARLTAAGEFALPPQRVLAGYYNPVIAVDAYNHVHLVVADSYYYPNPTYFILDAEGDLLLDGLQLNTRMPASIREEVQRIVIDGAGSRHFLWHAPDDDEGMLVYTRILSNSAMAVNQLTVTHLTDDWQRGGSSYDHPELLVDAQGAAHVLWRADGDQGTHVVFWRRINADGTLSVERQIPLGDYTDVVNGIKAAIDAQGQLHVLLDRARYRTSGYDLVYGRLDRDGNLLRPFHTLYTDGLDPRRARITIDQDGDAVVTFVEGGQPLYLLSSVPDAAANDKSRADLVADAAHATITPTLARVDETARLTITVWNAGWVTATDVTVVFTDTTGQAEITPATIAALPAMSHTVLARTFDVPDVEATSLVTVSITVEGGTPETTLTNNAAQVPMGVIPPPQHVDFQVVLEDETYVPGERSRADPVYGSELHLASNDVGHQRTVTSAGHVERFVRVPLNTDAPAPHTAIYTLTMSKSGYATIQQTITAQRSVSDVYRTVLTPTSPIYLYTNQWGVIEGTVLSATTPLTDVQVTLRGGERVTTTKTGAGGAFTFTRVPSDTYVLETLHAGNEPTTQTVHVRTEKTATPDIVMPPTTKGLVRGTVRNDLGHPYRGATVELWGDASKIDATTTDANGRYELVTENVDAYSAFAIEGNETYAQDYGPQGVALVAGLPTEHNFTLPWDAEQGKVTNRKRVVSWTFRQTWMKVNLGGSPVADLVETLADKLSKFDSFEIKGSWCEYYADLELAYTEVAGTKMPQTLRLGLLNGRYMYGHEAAIDETGGPFVFNADGVEQYPSQRTAERVDRIELVERDADGNIVTTHVIDDQQRYSGSAEGTDNAWIFDASGVGDVADWSNAEVRVYLRVGRYDDSLDPWDDHWEPWHPMVVAESFGGAGSAAGADLQVIVWDLSTNDVVVEPALVDYPEQPGLLATGEAAGDVRSAVKLPSTTQPAAELAASHEVSVTLPAGGPAQVGEPYTVTLRLGGAEDRPIYGVEFDLEYNYDPTASDRLFLLDITGAADLAGPYGTYKVHNPLAGFNRISEITDTAVVRLGGDQGLASGDLVQIAFLPLNLHADTRSDLHLTGVKVADVEGRQFSPDYGYYTSVPIEASAASVTVAEPEAGGGMTSTTGLTTSVQVPPDAVTQTVALVYEPLEDPGHPIPSTSRFAGRAFSLKAYTAGSVTPGITFDSPVLVTVHYDEAAVKTAGLDESALTLRRWNAATGSWEDAACGAYVRNEAEDWLQAPVCHLSDFGLFEQRLDLFLPVVIRSR
ncbi:MAG: carboxypeptidase regulatory-like domain-containing protein [Anaerolineae bacterium]